MIIFIKEQLNSSVNVSWTYIMFAMHWWHTQQELNVHLFIQITSQNFIPTRFYLQEDQRAGDHNLCTGTDASGCADLPALREDPVDAVGSREERRVNYAEAQMEAAVHRGADEIRGFSQHDEHHDERSHDSYEHDETQLAAASFDKFLVFVLQRVKTETKANFVASSQTL